MIESCVSQSISPLEEKVDAVEGQTVTLSCSYDGSVDYLFWYRQYPGSRPEFLLRIDAYSNVMRADPPVPGLDVKLDGNKLDLKISSAEVSDSVLYYCALKPTINVGGVSTCWNSRTQISPHYLNTGTTMMFLCSLSLFIIMIESCVSQSISPLEEKVDAVEGETVTLSCRCSSAYYLYWYRQHPGSRPEFLLRINPSTKDVFHAIPPFPRLEVKLDGNKLDLKISSAEVSDSVLYYCARGPTVTRSPSTLYKNSLTDKALSLHVLSPRNTLLFIENLGNTILIQHEIHLKESENALQYTSSRAAALTDLMKRCSAQSISPLENRTQVHTVEGQTVTLSCRYEYSGTVNSVQWYRQYPGSR
ncbi:hypothetical protein NFI96_031306, partial [Prochilodus magdalenae]